jgi:hypothetical protein
MTNHSTKESTEKKQKEPIRSRSLKSNFPIFKKGLFNTEPAPWGYNWFLGYCEQPNNFKDN